MQKPKLCWPQYVDDDGLVFLLTLDPFLILPTIDHIEFAGAESEVAGGVGRDQAVDNAIDLWRSAEIVLVRDEGHALIRLVGFELERSRSDRIQPKILTELLGALAADDHATVIVGYQSEECRHRLFQLDLHRRRIDRIDRLECCIVGIEG